MDPKNKVCYFYDKNLGNYYYGQGHPMKPHRIKMAHSLISSYGLLNDLILFQPHRASREEMTKFHSDEYIEFLSKISPDNMSEYSRQLAKFNVGEDCPVFDGLYEFCQVAAGASVGGAVKINHGACDIAINYAGGLHHAKKTEASGFCYVNDIVLGILELLKYHQRVLYIDIDIHHGDGVEEAFYTTDRVMTCSFHKFGGDFFPGTGSIKDVGYGDGKNFCVNVPLDDGMDDESFRSMFRPIVGKIMETFNPSAVVLQCGADSLAGDRLGCFNLTVEGHASCVDFVKGFGIPMLVLGGGGYTVRNVSRCWTYETAVLLDRKVKPELPFNDYLEYYGPEFCLNIPKTKMKNRNVYKDLERKKLQIIKNLSKIKSPPSVQIQKVPSDLMDLEKEKEIKDLKEEKETEKLKEDLKYLHLKYDLPGRSYFSYGLDDYDGGLDVDSPVVLWNVKE